MTNDGIQRYTISGDIAYPIHEDPEGDYVTYDDHVAAIEADRKRRGEPVAYHPCTSILIEGLKRLPGGSAILAEWDKARSKVDAPQPAEPCASSVSNKTACGSENGDCDSQRAESESCFCDRMYPDSNPDASCGDCPIRDYGAKAAEPVKVPLGGDILQVWAEEVEEFPLTRAESSRLIRFARALLARYGGGTL